jgi:hypothetical protein
VLQHSFSAKSWTRSIASGEGWSNSSGRIQVSAALQAVVRDEVMKDGRSTHLLFQYGKVPGRPAGVYSLQPFFQYRVCFLYPLPGVAQGMPAERWDQALGVVWCPNGLTTNDGCVFETYNRTEFAGQLTVGGQACGVWEYTDNSPPKTTQVNRFCVTSRGELISVNITFDGEQKLNNDTFHSHAFSENVFSAFAPLNQSAFVLPELEGCVDLRPIDMSATTSDNSSTVLNSERRISRINAEADGWVASAQNFWEGQTLSAAYDLAGLKMGALQLPLPTEQHRLGRGEAGAISVCVWVS